MHGKMTTDDLKKNAFPKFRGREGPRLLPWGRQVAEMGYQGGLVFQSYSPLPQIILLFKKDAVLLVCILFSCFERDLDSQK